MYKYICIYIHIYIYIHTYRLCIYAYFLIHFSMSIGVPDEI